MADTYKGATGASDEATKVYFKKLRGEDLTPQEWKVWRENYGAKYDGPEIYDVAPF